MQKISNSKRTVFDPKNGHTKAQVRVKTDQNGQFSDQKIHKDGKIDEKVLQMAYLSTQNEVEPYQINKN